jgi:hypothetical protein
MGGGRSEGANQPMVSSKPKAQPDNRPMETIGPTTKKTPGTYARGF